jgi:pimeloyl-ACP methyl ester carboxylesterase
MRFIVLLPLFLLFSFTEAQERLPYFETTPCNTAVLAIGLEASCGELIVPEDRLNDDANIIRLDVVILHAQTPTPADDPLVILRGGPGGITIPVFDTGFRTEYMAFLDTRDVIIFDQRGVSQLDCPAAITLDYENAATPPNERVPNSRARMLAACHADLITNGYQPQAYTSAQNAADVRDLVNALGYEQVNLLGISYGTRLGLTILRDYPYIVRSAIFDSVYPLEVTLYGSIGQSQRRAFNHLFEACEDDAACNAAYPNFRRDYYNVLGTLNQSPLSLSVVNPSNDKTYTIRIDGSLIGQAVYDMIYDGENIPLIPQAINRLIEDRDPTLFLPLIKDRLNRSAGISEGMYYSIQCNEEVPFEEFFEPELARDANERSFMTRVCAGWQRRTPAPIENAPVRSDVPTLLFSGAFDPITPPAWAQQVSDNMDNSFNYVLPDVGHGVVRSSPCALTIAQQFLDAPTSEPDTDCIGSIGGVAFQLP